MYIKSHNIEIMMDNETDEIIEKLSESFLENYKNGLKEEMRASDSVPEIIDLLYYHLQKVGLKRAGSYIDSPEWLKNKKAIINPNNNDDNRFQYTLTIALNHQNYEKPSKDIKNYYWSV